MGAGAIIGRGEVGAIGITGSRIDGGLLDVELGAAAGHGLVRLEGFLRAELSLIQFEADDLASFGAKAGAEGDVRVVVAPVLLLKVMVAWP